MLLLRYFEDPISNELSGFLLKDEYWYYLFHIAGSMGYFQSHLLATPPPHQPTMFP